MRNQNTKTTQDEYEKHAHALGAAIVGLLLAQRGGGPPVVVHDETNGEQNYWTIAELSDEFRCASKTLKRRLVKYGIKLKDRTSAKQKILVPLAEVKKLRRLWGK